MGSNDRVNACPELDFPHTSLWCGGCHSRQQTSRIANALEDLVSKLSTEEGTLEMNITKEEKKFIPRPRKEDNKRTFRGVDL
jgi:hypothetical protein